AILEKYTEGRMSPEEKNDFEKRIKDEPGFKEELENFILSKSAIRFASNKRLKTKLDDIGAALEDKYTRKTRTLAYLMAAAGVALLIGMGWLMNHNFQPRKSYEEIFLSYYQRPEINEMSFRSTAGDSVMMKWHKAMDHYTAGDMQEAITEFGHITDMSDVTFSSRTSFFLGICYLESNQPEAALQAFNRVKKNSSYGYETQFYKALCYIKLGKQEDAVELLDIVRQDNNHPRRKEAAKLLKDLDRLIR
ncbi:MAG: tetratricopeptide repeat protein, partial [Bacteroidales bacterium]|nr:tetratricopeptide repeat protein [Bacteroidales bacterium]